MIQMKEIEVKLFDGFVIDEGWFPYRICRGFVPKKINRTYIVSSHVVRHELYGILLREVGMGEKSEQNACDSNCFASHEVDYTADAGLCEKHLGFIASLKGKVRINIKNTLFCDKSKTEQLREELGLYERDFAEKTAVQIGSMHFSRNPQKINHGDWLVVYLDRDAIVPENELMLHGIKLTRLLGERIVDYDENGGILVANRLLSIGPQSLEEYMGRIKEIL
jgi:hypothetical protein